MMKLCQADWECVLERLHILLGHNSLKGIDRLKLKHVLPWKIGAASLHRSTYMHCATDWSKIGTEKRHVFFMIRFPGYDK